MKKLFTSIILCSLSLFAIATVHLDETFSGSYTSLKDASSGWTFTETAGHLGIREVATTPELTYSNGGDYVLSGMGRTLFNDFQGSANASFISYKQFTSTPVNSGDIYLSFLLKIQKKGGSNAQMIGLASSGSTTNGLVVWYGQSSTDANKFRIGITRQSGAGGDVQWIGGNDKTESTYFDANATHLVVMKYNFTDETMYLFMNPVIASTEPTTADASQNTKGSPPSSLSHILMRANGSNSVFFYTGGLRVSNSWAEAVAMKSGTTPLVAPTVGEGSDATSTGFTANWTPNDAAATTGYDIEVYYKSILYKTVSVTGGDANSAEISNLLGGIAYNYKVRATCDNGNNGNSDYSTLSADVTLPKGTPAANDLKIILKLDDLSASNKNKFKMAPTMEYLVSKQVKAGFGAIANRFESNVPEDLIRYIAEKNESGELLFEIWHHGLEHIENEFKGTTYEYQKGNFDEAHNIIKNLLGVEMLSFGSPYNASDATTLEVLKEANYKVFMLPSVKGNATDDVLYLTNRVNMENGTGVVDFNYFVTNYDKNKSKYTDYMILQGHPNYYTGSVLENFELIVEFLINEGVEFVLPYEYYKLVKNVSGMSQIEKDKTIFSVSDGKCISSAQCSSIKLYNLNGCLVGQSSGNNILLPTKGIYIVQGVTTNGTFTQKIINK